MQVFGIETPLIRKGDPLAAIISSHALLKPGDIVVISSKAVATAEGAAIDLANIPTSPQAHHLAVQYGKTDSFCQAVMDEAARMNGKVLSGCPGAMLTELKPAGLASGTLLVPNAGLDQSNVQQGFAIGWPVDPVLSVRALRKSLEGSLEETDKTKGSDDSSVSSDSSVASVSYKGKQITSRRIAVIISDSCCKPRRKGVTAFALTVSGIDPVQSQIGKPDLFGRPLQMTSEAVADQLATAANMVMGNAAQATPAAIIRDHGFALSDYEGWVEGIEPEEDLFAGIV